MVGVRVGLYRGCSQRILLSGHSVYTHFGVVSKVIHIVIIGIGETKYMGVGG